MKPTTGNTTQKEAEILLFEQIKVRSCQAKLERGLNFIPTLMR